MPKQSMTSKERWLAVLNHQKPDRAPMTYRATEEAHRKLMEHLGLSSNQELHARLHLDPIAGVGPRYVGPPVSRDADIFGCRYTVVQYATGKYRECISHPLAHCGSVEEIERTYTWPSPDWWDYSEIPARAAAIRDRPISGGSSEPFLTYSYLRGQEQAMMDLALNPEIAHYCLDKLFGLCCEQALRIYEQVPGLVLITSVSEDLGTQEDLLYSPAHIREFLLPRMKRMMDQARQAGAFVFCHSDGAIRKILPDLVEAGVNVLDPVQWRCKGMDREALKRDFGDKLVFHGAMDNQYTLPFGTAEEVRQEVLDNLRILGEGGGYILGPCHNIQAVGPPENIVAMYDTAYESGWM